MGCSQRLVASAIKMALGLACAIAMSATSHAQQLQQVQAVVDGISSPQHAAMANEVLAPIAGVVMSRLDFRTKNLFMHVRPDCQLDAASLRLLIEPLGLSVRCFQRRNAVTGQFSHLDPQNCDTPLVPSR